MGESEINENIKKHLEFLGYTLDSLNAETGYTYIAKSDSHGNLLVRIFKNCTILSIRYFGIHKNAIKSKEFHTALNEINQKVMSKWFYETNEDESDVTIVIEADYYDYERTTFGKFIDQLNSEDSFGMQLLKKFIEKDNR